MKTFFISTAIPYVNAPPHIGHALEFVEADVLARHARISKEDVFFLTGTDDNAFKNVQAAEEAGISTKDWVNKNAGVFQRLLGKLKISNDDFIRTSIENRHIKGSQKLWIACKNDIYKKKYRGLYCIGCEEFKTEKEPQSGECPEHPGIKLEEVEEENYFFKLSKYEKELEKLIQSGKLEIIPESRRNEALSFIKSGLEDFSISRTRERSKGWGIPVPNDDSQIIYVWFDALSNYINALGYFENNEKFDSYWEKSEKRIHVIGKGINRFHSIYWPAMLLSAGIRVPSTVFIHGYITANGQKISKSLGNVVDPFQIIEKYGTDALRYFLLREIPSFDDGDFSNEKFRERYNADLANGLGNFTARVLTLANGHEFSKIKTKIETEVDKKISATKNVLATKIAEFRLNESIAAIWELISFGDKYVNEKQPWKTSDKTVILNAIVLLDNVAALLKSFLPETSAKITGALNWEGDSLKVRKIDLLFPRI